MQNAQTLFFSLLKNTSASCSKDWQHSLIYALSISPFLGQVWQQDQAFFTQSLTPLSPLAINYHQELQTLLQKVQKNDDFRGKLRQFRHRETARLALYQALSLLTVEDTFERLSDLAEAILLNARDWLYQKAIEAFGTPCDSQGRPIYLTIWAMGKLGGRELNFSSDVDLIFTYSEQGETRGGKRTLTHQQFFTKLCQQLIKDLNDFTEEGIVYRIDMRLRPFGDSGALIMA